MPIATTLFEGLDLLDLWHLYGQIKVVGGVRNVSGSKVSRQSRDLMLEMGVLPPDSRGAPDPGLLVSGAFLSLRGAYQHWRLELDCVKVLPTFAASVLFRDIAPSLDVLPDVYLTAEEIADHLQLRRVDLVLSSSLDLAGELILEAGDAPDSRFAVVPLFQEPIHLAVNPSHPLAGLREALPEDCQAFPSAGYPEGVARLAAEALRARGLWRFAAKRNRFDASEWSLGMRAPTGLCYRTLFLEELVPECRELVSIPLASSLLQTNCIVMLREIAEHPGTQAAVDRIRRQVRAVLSRSKHPFSRC